MVMARLGECIGKTDWFKDFECLQPNLPTLLTGLFVPMAVRKKDRLLVFHKHKEEDGCIHFNIMYVNKRFVELFIETTRCECCQAPRLKETLDAAMELRASDEAPLRIPIMIFTQNNLFVFAASVPDANQDENVPVAQEEAEGKVNDDDDNFE